MRYIINDRNIVDTIIGEQTINEDVNYRLLNFCYIKKVDNTTILYNNFTKKMIELNEDETRILEMLPHKYMKSFENLVKGWFLVPVDNSDTVLVDQVLEIKRVTQKKDYVNSFVILTTTECNARCYYCYENGVTKTRMELDTASDVADFIIKKSKGKKVSIKWFGGEPLYNAEAIDVICDKLESSGVQFSCRITTNGYLFNQHNVAKAKNKWKISHVQISLDGTEKKYNRIKAYIHKEDNNPFKTVTDNIENLLKNGISVSVRLNVSDINRQDMYNLIDYLYDRYKGYGNLNVYSANLFDLNYERTDIEATRQVDEYLKLEEYLISKGLHKMNFDGWLSFRRGCMAQIENSLCISPNGLLCKCEHYSEGERMHGSIYTDIVDEKALSYWNEFKRIPECDTCVAYPNCYGITNCPDCSRKCSIVEKRIKYKNLDTALVQKYHSIKK